MWTIKYYELENGRSPVEEFIDSLVPQMRAKAFWELGQLEVQGNLLTMPYARYMEDGIYELRIRCASNISRIFYFFRVGNNIIMTNGFIKKTDKTPPQELKMAKKYKLDYERRCGR